MVDNYLIKAREEQGKDITILKQEAEWGNILGSVDLLDILFLIYQIIGLASVIIYMLFILI